MLKDEFITAADALKRCIILCGYVMTYFQTTINQDVNVDTVHSDSKCVLTTGFTGEMCQIDIDECVSTPCYNGAKCLDRPNGYECECAEGSVIKMICLVYLQYYISN